MFKSKFYIHPDEIAKLYQNDQTMESFAYDQDIDIYENAIILPLRRYKSPNAANTEEPINHGGVCDENFNLLAGYVCSEKINGSSAIEYWLPYRPDKILYSDESVIFAGDLNKHFGHFITDSITRMWYAVKATDQNLKIALLLNSTWSWADWNLDTSYHLKLLQMAGIKKERIIIVDKPTQFKSVIVPKQAVYWHGKRYNSELLKIFYNNAMNSVVPKNDKKIYLSKSKWDRKPLFNESFFENFFSSRGFKIIHPQDLPIEEQIAHIVGADEIACTNGTLPHFTLFAKPKTKLICLLRSGASSTIRQQLIDHINNIDSVYVDVSFNFLPSQHIFSNQLLVPLPSWRSFLKNEYEIESDTDIFDYLNHSDIRFGDYFREYIRTLSQRFYSGVYGFNFNPVTYLRSIYYALDFEGANRLYKAVKITDNPLFREKLFLYTRPGIKLKCKIKLLADGRIWIVDANGLKDERFWSYLKGRLYFLNKDLAPFCEFVIEEAESRKPHAKYNGVVRSKVTDICSLEHIKPGEKRNWIIRHAIKYVVNKRRYNKLKKRPDRFFKDSKSPLIRFLGRYYIRGNSTVIFYWRKAFKDYFDTHDMKKMVEELKEGMDGISVTYIDNFMRLSKYWFDSSCVGNQWTEHDLKKQRECKRFAKTLVQPFPDILNIKPYFFYDIYGLADLPQEVLSSIDGKIIIDGGG